MTIRPSTATRVAGLVLTGTGVAHFLRPDTFESVLRSPFPLNTRWHMYVNGVKETMLGLGIVVPRTRRVALAAAVVHLVRLARNANRHGRAHVELDVDWAGRDHLDEDGLVEVYPIEEFPNSSENPAPVTDATAQTQREPQR